jgi:preprotein translocase subunit SecE
VSGGVSGAVTTPERGIGEQTMKKWYQSSKEFFADVATELKKVSFPTRTETMGSTSVVLIFVAAVAIFLSAMDAVLVKLVAVLLQ